MKMMQALSGESPKKAASDKPKVAVIYAAGMIQTGKSSSGGLLGDGGVIGLRHASSSTCSEAEKDKTVKAIVLRVDSPGGSALASDLMWREITRIEKPIVASMSDVAASGGYYISMGCDKIFAEPGTLTGSIGVISIKLVPGRPDGARRRDHRHRHRRQERPARLRRPSPYTDEEKAALQPPLRRRLQAVRRQGGQGPQDGIRRAGEARRGPRLHRPPGPEGRAWSTSWARSTTPSTPPRSWPAWAATPTASC